jgi:hypothetical protein
MHTVNVHDSAKAGDPVAQRLCWNHNQTRKRPGKIYSVGIPWPNNCSTTVFQTTSKDVFLGLGMMEPTFLPILAEFLSRKLFEHGCNELLLEMSGSTALVTRTLEQSPERTIYTVSPAH